MARSFRQVAAATRIHVLGSWVGENRLPGAQQHAFAAAGGRELVGIAAEIRPQVHAARRRTRDLRAHSYQRLGGTRAALVEPHAHAFQHAFIASLDDDARDHAFAQLRGSEPGECLDVAQLAAPAPDARR